MSSDTYAKAREAFLGGSINLSSDNIKAVLVYTGAAHYQVNLATDQYLSSIVSGDRIATSGNLASKTVTAGVFDAADVTLTAVTGTQVGAIVVYKDTGSAATSPLLAYIDNPSAFPYTPNGADVTITWDNGANKIFAI